MAFVLAKPDPADVDLFLREEGRVGANSRHGGLVALLQELAGALPADGHAGLGGQLVRGQLAVVLAGTRLFALQVSLVRLHHTAEVVVGLLQLLKLAGRHHSPVVQHVDEIAAGQEVQLVHHQHASLALQSIQQAVLHDVLAHVGVDSGQGVIEQVGRQPGVSGAGDRDPLLLPAAEVDASVADLGHVSVGQGVQVSLQSADVDDLPVAFLIKGLAKQDILSDALCTDPGRLCDVGHSATLLQLGLRHLFGADGLHLTQQCEQERGFPTPYCTHHRSQLASPGFELDVVQLERCCLAHLIVRPRGNQDRDLAPVCLLPFSCLPFSSSLLLLNSDLLCFARLSWLLGSFALRRSVHEGSPDDERLGRVGDRFGAGALHLRLLQERLDTPRRHQPHSQLRKDDRHKHKRELQTLEVSQGSEDDNCV
mmetsp:Transcript_7771/g.14774  ORF Transcript_7771/g.14774 Transcript_7771/m.14774 type:complete len:424 (-) Transcript_7771:514-1785(-)